MDVVDIEYLENKYFTENKPVPYQLRNNNTILIYPILVREWYDFSLCYSILTFQKRDIPIPEIIQMSYLQFLFEVIFIEKEQVTKLKKLLSLCLHEKIDDIFFKYNENDRPIIVIVDEEGIIKQIITSKDFDEISRIILYQNIVGYDDTYISKDIRDVIEEVESLKNKDLETVSLERKMTFLGNELKMLNTDMLNMTYREFTNRFDMAIESMDYKINRTAELSGNVKFNQPIEHLIYKKHKNKYDQFFTDKDAFTSKIENA